MNKKALKRLKRRRIIKGKKQHGEQIRIAVNRKVEKLKEKDRWINELYEKHKKNSQKRGPRAQAEPAVDLSENSEKEGESAGEQAEGSDTPEQSS